MKFNFKVLLMIVTVCFLSVSVMAAKGNEVDSSDKKEQTASDVQNEETGEETDIGQDVTEPESIQQKASETVVKTVAVFATEDDITADNCVILGKAFAQTFINETKSATEYPFIIDLTVYSKEIDAVIVSEDIIRAAIEADFANKNQNETVQPTVEDKDDKSKESEKSSEKEETVVENDLTLDEAALKIVTKSGEYSWKKKSLKEFKNANADVKLVLEKADNIFAVATEEVAELEGNLIEFNPEEGKSKGFLKVLKNDKGNWEIKNEYLFSSNLPIVIAIGIIVLVNFALIIMVNLIIIKIHKGKK